MVENCLQNWGIKMATEKELLTILSFLVSILTTLVGFITMHIRNVLVRLCDKMDLFNERLIKMETTHENCSRKAISQLFRREDDKDIRENLE